MTLTLFYSHKDLKLLFKIVNDELLMLTKQKLNNQQKHAARIICKEDRLSHAKTLMLYIS